MTTIKYKSGTALCPIVQPNGSIRTGYAVIIEQRITHPTLVDMGYSSHSYLIMTNFGNTLLMTTEELLSSYTIDDSDPECTVKERIEQQMQKLQDVLNILED